MPLINWSPMYTPVMAYLMMSLESCKTYIDAQLCMHWTTILETVI